MDQLVEAAPEKPDITMNGLVTVQFVFDGAWAIDVEKARKWRATFGKNWVDEVPPQSGASERGQFRYDVAPLSVKLPGKIIELNGHHTVDQVDLLIDDSGAISLTMSVPLDKVQLDKLPGLTAAIYNSRDLREEAARLAAEVVEEIRPYSSLQRTPSADDEYEDYVVVFIDSVEGCELSELSQGRDLLLAQILLGETDPLDPQRVAAHLEHSMSYYPGDRVIIDWRGALCIGGGWSDVASVLSVVNIELLELKLLRAHVSNRTTQMTERFCLSWWPDVGSWLGWNLREVQLLDLEIRLQLKRIDNPLNLAGDSFLAGVYELACEILNVRSEESSTKDEREDLKNLESTIAERAAAKRADVLAFVGVLVAFSFFTDYVEKIFSYLMSFVR